MQVIPWEDSREFDLGKRKGKFVSVNTTELGLQVEREVEGEIINKETVSASRKRKHRYPFNNGIF